MNKFTENLESSITKKRIWENEKIREITDNYINEFKFSGENRGIPLLIVQGLVNNILCQNQTEKGNYSIFGGRLLSLLVYIPIRLRGFTTTKTRRMAFSITYKYNDTFYINKKEYLISMLKTPSISWVEMERFSLDF